MHQKNNTPFSATSIASTTLKAMRDRTQITPFSSTDPGFDLETAYHVTPFLRASFEAEGETVVGRKIGFTNREMWKLYGVEAPIWGYCTDKTTFDLEAAPKQSIYDFCEPRIEPEIVFGLKGCPLPTMEEAELLTCIAWVALGFEIVQSLFPNWVFEAPDTVVANGLHGRLLIGPRQPIDGTHHTWIDDLANFRIELLCNGTLNQTGGGTLVLGSPLLALQHLVRILADDPHNPPLSAGEIVTTGTLTPAIPVHAGETWAAQIAGLAVENISLQFGS